MHDAMRARWRHARRHHGCAGPDDGNRGCGSYGWEGAFAAHHPGHHGGGFGVRRPLRFLAYRLELDEDQVAELAGILDDIKTERAQHAVDERRALKAYAEAVAGETFDAEKAKAAGAQRQAASQRLEETLVDALGRIHALLDEGQRSRLAYLIRSGHLSL